MAFSIGSLISLLSDFIWNVFRVGGFYMVVPIFGNQLIPARVRILLAAATALALVPILGSAPLVTEWGAQQIGHLVVQSLMGVGLGFATVIFFHIFVIAGQFIGMQMGLGFAAMVDPGNGIQVTVWSQFFLMLVTLSFLAINGHLALLEILVTGFSLYPIGTAFDMTTFIWQVVSLGGWMFLGGALLALPAVVALLIVNIAFGVMNRSAPQLNVFSLGFPFGLMFGLIIIWFLLSNWSDQFTGLVSEFTLLMQDHFKVSS